MDFVGLVFVVVFYAAILIFGVVVARSKGVFHPTTVYDLILAGKSLGVAVGICTLVATEVNKHLKLAADNVCFNWLQCVFYLFFRSVAHLSMGQQRRSIRMVFSGVWHRLATPSA